MQCDVWVVCTVGLKVGNSLDVVGRAYQPVIYIETRKSLTAGENGHRLSH